MINLIPEETVPGMHCLVVYELMLCDNTEMESNKQLNFRENMPLLQDKNQNTSLPELLFFARCLQLLCGMYAHSVIQGGARII